MFYHKIGYELSAMQTIRVPKLDEYESRALNLSKSCLQIELQTLQPIAHTEPIHLDGLLAYAVVIDAMQGQKLPPSTNAYWLPLPLGLEKTYNELPLWQSIDFAPINPEVANTHYHQRGDSNPYSLASVYPSLEGKKVRRLPPTTEGQYMSYRVPLHHEVADYWQAKCIGNKQEIERLLNTYVHYVGKKASFGMGRVAKFSVTEIDSFELCDRPIPIENGEDILKYGSIQYMGWSIIQPFSPIPVITPQ